jgi:coenzyme F420-reducing hydrogenase delta subunit
MFDVKVFTASAAGAQQLVEHTTRQTWKGAADLRGILRMQYPPHAYVITIQESAATREP